MGKDPRIAIRDVLREIDLLHDLARRLSLDDFLADPVSQHAAAYAVQIISEAVRHIPDDWLAEFPSQPWAANRAIGNKIRHEYYRIDDGMLWSIMKSDSHDSKTAMISLLAKHNGPQAD